MSGIAERLRSVRARVERACLRAGRDLGQVAVVAVSKTRAIEELREAFEKKLDIATNRKVIR